MKYGLASAKKERVGVYVRLLTILLFSVALVGCSGIGSAQIATTASNQSVSPNPSPSPSPSPSPAPSPSPSPSPSPAPSPSPSPNPSPTPAPSPSPLPSTLTHGKDLTLAMVGPSAIGITSFTNANGGANISETSTGSWVKKVNATATYDGFTVNGAHLLIQGVSFSGALDISSSIPVVIRGSKIRNSGYWSIFARDGAPVYVLYSDVGGTDSTSNGQSGEVIQDSNDGHNVFFRNHLSNGGDAFSIGAKNDQILENYLDKFNTTNDAHNDGLQSPGNCDGMMIARNKCILDSGETGCINLGTWAGGTAQYVTIDSNYFAGGGYTIYGGAGGAKVSNHIVVTNNIFGYDIWPNIGQWGAVAYWESGPGNVWTNNNDTKGNAVTP